jgi:hypothetical protein
MMYASRQELLQCCDCDLVVKFSRIGIASYCRQAVKVAAWVNESYERLGVFMFVRYGIAVLVVWSCIPNNRSVALDYNASWDFTVPISQLPPWSYGTTDFLRYNVNSGSLVYRVGADGWWSPPDVGSISGLLNAPIPFQPVPLWGTPIFRTDETFGGVVVPASNAIRVGFDRYSFWPWTPEDPLVLQRNGLDRTPHLYSYGEVLPPGLTTTTLMLDLFATSFPGKPIELQVVAEPFDHMSLFLIAGSLFIYGSRSARKRSIPSAAP